jgi:hypothetical protein
VGNELASDEFTVTLLLPSTGYSRLLLVWLLSLEARTALCFGRERDCIGKNCFPLDILTHKSPSETRDEVEWLNVSSPRRQTAIRNPLPIGCVGSCLVERCLNSWFAKKSQGVKPDVRGKSLPTASAHSQVAGKWVWLERLRFLQWFWLGASKAGVLELQGERREGLWVVQRLRGGLPSPREP